MSQLINSQAEELRYERKFLVVDRSVSEIEQLLKFNPACFSEIYEERTVNNVYFDTFGFNNYYDNVEGNTERIKPRIRWYGELFGPAKAILEFKIKKGLMGKKEFYKLANFSLDKDFSRAKVVNALDMQKTPIHILDIMRSVYPTVLNSYNRKYFISADKNFRITIDKDLSFFGIGYNQPLFLNKVKKYNVVVVELKYNAMFEEEAKTIAGEFPFALTKNSKYLQGIESVLF
jgi:SPX domain protein involved in polyphosphate accumulation